MKKALAFACATADIGGLHFHALQHTTTWLDEASVSGAGKKKIIEHSSGILHQRYNTLSPDILKNAK